MENRPQSAKPEEVAKVYREVAKRAAKVLNDLAKKRPQLGAVSDELGIAKAYMDLYARMLADPMAGALPYEHVAAMTDELLTATSPWLAQFDHPA